MMEDYANETGLADFIVYGTTDTYTGDGSFCPKAFAESKAGYCVDLALNAYGSVILLQGRIFFSAVPRRVLTQTRRL